MANKKVGLYRRRRKRNVVNDVGQIPMGVGQLFIPMQNLDLPSRNYFESEASVPGRVGEYNRPMDSVTPVRDPASDVVNPMAMENDYGPVEIRTKKKIKKLRSTGTPNMRG